MSQLVLIVESDVALAAAMRMALMWRGYRVVEAQNGAAAVGLLKSAELPHLILTALDMPFVTGWELLDICRRDPRLRSIPTIALDESDGSRLDGLATATLARPFGIDQLIQLVQSTLAIASSRPGPGGS
jgi:CheY-like chemotaxis protein